MRAAGSLQPARAAAATPPAAPAGAAGAVLRLGLLHLPRLHLPDGSALRLAPNDAALLALLALDGPCARATAAALLWPDVDDEHGRNNLRQRLFRWRRSAGRELVTAGPVLALASGVEHDLDDAERRLARDPTALRGELLDGIDYGDRGALARWVAGARERWRARRRDALEATALALEAQDRLAEALACIERLALDEPLLEHVQRRLMRLHYRRGDRGAALMAYAALCRSFASRLTAGPSRETRELAALIEAGVPLPLDATSGNAWVTPAPLP
jgi:DNA-binding SARP family transcriptional activator